MVLVATLQVRQVHLNHAPLEPVRRNLERRKQRMGKGAKGGVKEQLLMANNAICCAASQSRERSQRGKQNSRGDPIVSSEHCGCAPGLPNTGHWVLDVTGLVPCKQQGRQWACPWAAGHRARVRYAQGRLWVPPAAGARLTLVPCVLVTRVCPPVSRGEHGSDKSFKG